jgi:hypothetical protein
MKTRNLIAALSALFIVPIAFGQGMYGGGYNAPQAQPPASTNSGQQKTTTTTTTKKVMPEGVKGYLDDQLAHSNDKKFHVALNGKDLALTPVTFHPQQKNMTAVDMKGADGKVYEIDFVTSKGQVTGAKVGKVNGKAP